MKQIKFSDQVFKKDFTVKALGYSCEEIDAFFDEVNLEIAKLERENDSLKEKLDAANASLSVSEGKVKDLQKKFYNLKAENGVSNNNTDNLSNIEIYNRLSSLEKMVQQLIDYNKSKDGRF